MPTSNPALSPRRIEAETFIRHVEWFAELASTNDLALTRAAEPSTELPRLIWAGQQTAGRGRGANQWWSAPEGLTFSILVDGPAIGLPPACWPQLSMVTSLAVAVTLRQFLPDDRIGLKWPNDVQVDGRKICGILVEPSPVIPARVVIGMGLNVGNSFHHAPAELQSQAIALVDVLANPPELVDLLIELLNSWDALSQSLRGGQLNLVERWSPHCVLSHEAVTLTRGSEKIDGICRGISREGALLIEVGGRFEQHWAGTVRLAD